MSVHVAVNLNDHLGLKQDLGQVLVPADKVLPRCQVG